MSDRPDQILTAIAELHGDVAQLRGDMTQMRGDMTQLHGDVAQLRGDMMQLHGDVAQLRGDMTQMRGDVAQLLGDMMGKLEQIQNDLTGIHEDIGVNMGRAERALATNENTRNELRMLGGEVAAMWRQIKRLETEIRELRDGK
jgi:outer membrane murein-binding lipoprotein Lpp